MANIADRTFRTVRRGPLVAVAFALLFGPGCATWESFRERSSNLRHELLDSAWEDPKAEEEEAKGEQFYNEGNYREAIKHFKKVADNQGNNTQLAEQARFWQAESRYFLGEWPDAVDTYHRLLIDFPTGAHRQQSVARMYEIASYWLIDFQNEIERRSGEKGVLRWQPSWPEVTLKEKPWIDQEGRALEAMENIHTQDITGPYADKALFWCGYVNFIRGRFQSADRYFSDLVEMHRESPLRPQALAYAIQSKNNATGGAVYDGRKCAEALQLVNVAEATVPELTQNREMADKLTRAKFAIRSQQAEKDFRTAEYYERVGHPGSAVFYYELVRRRFAGTRYADIATERKEYLLAQLHAGHPSVGLDPLAVAKEKWKEATGQKVPGVDNTGSPRPDANSTTVPAGGIQPGTPAGGMPGGGVVPGGGVIPGGGVLPGGGVIPGTPMNGPQR